MNERKGQIVTAKLVLVLLIALAMLLASGAAPAQARATVQKDKIEFPVEWIDWVSCAMGGLGEEVYVTGTFRVTSQVTIDNRGKLHGRYQVLSGDLKGVGLTTGDIYQGQYMFQDYFNSGVTYTHTYGDKIKFTGQGPGNNLAASFQFHMTVNANGEVTAYIDDTRYECK